MAVDQERLQDFMGRMVGEFGVVASAALIVLGDKLGLYRAMAGQGAIISANLAKRTGMTERYLREWLAAQAAAGFVELRRPHKPMSSLQSRCYALLMKPVLYSSLVFFRFANQCFAICH